MFYFAVGFQTFEMRLRLTCEPYVQHYDLKWGKSTSCRPSEAEERLT